MGSPNVQNVPSVFEEPLNFEEATEPVQPTPGPTKYTPAPRFRNPRIITQEAILFFPASMWHNPPSYFMPQILGDTEAVSAAHNVTSEI